jgi:DNA-binding MarR family transcriptional regulator
MNQKFRFSSTYLFKIHALKRALDKAFDGVLRKHAGITLSLFTVLLAVSEHEEINQRQVAAFLGISAVAVKRQVDLAHGRKFLNASHKSSGGGQALRLTEAGQSAVQASSSISRRHQRIDSGWWARNVGNEGTAEGILERFDRAYARDFGAKIEAGSQGD